MTHKCEWCESTLMVKVVPTFGTPAALCRDCQGISAREIRDGGVFV